MEAARSSREHRAANQGMNWIRKEKRLAIYIRDGLACCYCGEGVEEGAKLTLDHYLPRCKGGTNDASNLLTACHRCNSYRQSKTVHEFVTIACQYTGREVRDVLAHIRNARRRMIYPKRAKAIIEKRGFREACKGDC